MIQYKFPFWGLWRQDSESSQWDKPPTKLAAISIWGSKVGFCTCCFSLSLGFPLSLAWNLEGLQGRNFSQQLPSSLVSILWTHVWLTGNPILSKTLFSFLDGFEENRTLTKAVWMDNYRACNLKFPFHLKFWGLLLSASSAFYCFSLGQLFGGLPKTWVEGTRWEWEGMSEQKSICHK